MDQVLSQMFLRLYQENCINNLNIMLVSDHGMVDVIGHNPSETDEVTEEPMDPEKPYLLSIGKYIDLR